MRRTMLSMESLQEEEEEEDDDDEAEEDEWEREKDAAMWRSVLDEASQKTYYYHIISRESVWDKPLALCSARERADVARRNDQQRSFFAEMEGNIRTKIGQGLLFGGATPPSMPSTPAGGKFAISMVAGGGTEEEDPSAQQRLRRNSGDRLCRTISTMDGRVSSSSTGASAATSCNPGGGSGGPDLPRRSHRRQLSSGSGGSSSGSISAAGELAGADEFPAGGSGAGRGSGVYRYDDAGACVRAGAGLEAARLAEHGGDGHFTEGAGAGAGVGAAAAVRNHRHSLPPSIVRRNSTSTIYLAAHDTLSDPDLDATIRCVCAVLRAHMIAALADGREDDGGGGTGTGTGGGGGGGGDGGGGGSSVSREGGGVWVGERRDCWRGVNVKVFDDPMEEGSHAPAAVPEGGGGREADEAAGEAVVVPPLRDITAFYRDLYHRTCLKFDSIVLSLIYMERLMKETKGAIRPQPWNWKSLIISALVLSSKVWDDNSMWNRDFSEVFPSFSLGRLNQLEVAVLGVLRFNVKVLSSEYAKYYFHLRAMCVRGGLSDSHAPIHPLDMEGIKELEAMSLHSANDAKLLRKVAKSGYAFTDKHGPSLSLEQVVSSSSGSNRNTATNNSRRLR
ncbi:conserved unknown protein [Ectocarpus siliculosus]|uniref:WW domain-containing protein n=1 Tax=Ectocarpus siliculosus TaxID=2880 RepID=D8LI84_ECTSI|nr:conserved unknown protein [Ectocarpus siliculosus]|eukprot:CBN75906.1 conserved unknown protein [Ectocarpus siliculosus]